MRTENYERKELRRLEAERTRKQNHIRLSYRSRLNGKISLEQYEEVQTGAQADLHGIGADIEKLSQRNFKYREQGSRVLELLNGMKDVYRNADLAGKHKFLEVMVDRIMLRVGQAFVHWQEPFQTLFDLGEMFTNKKMWGPTLYKYLSLIRHIDLTRHIQSLGRLIRMYDPSLCPAGA